MKYPFLVGKNIYLRPHIKDDLEKWCQWRNDQAITRWMYAGDFPNAIESQESFFHNVIETGKDGKHLQLAIVDIESDTLFGTHSLTAIDNIHGHAEYAIVIGEQVRGKGIGREAAALIHYHAFSTLRLHRVWAGQHENLNKWRDVLVEWVGYREEGVLREMMWKHNKWWNVHIIGCLEKDFWQKWKLKWSDFFEDIHA